MQFNHVWQTASDVETYTSLANICVTPSFLAKLTDTDPEIAGVLRYRASELYGFAPCGPVSEPVGYRSLQWAELMPPVVDVESVLRAALRERRGRTAECARRLGWLFSNFAPDKDL